MWARRGSRPTAVRQTEYSYLWVVGAVSPQSGQAEAILSPVLNTSIINQFLEQFSRSLSADEHAVMIWDGAGFHRGGQLQVPDNVSVIQLPPYSPELAPHRTLQLRICGITSAATTGRIACTLTTTISLRSQNRPGCNTVWTLTSSCQSAPPRTSKAHLILRIRITKYLSTCTHRRELTYSEMQKAPENPRLCRMVLSGTALFLS